MLGNKKTGRITDVLGAVLDSPWLPFIFLLQMASQRVSDESTIQPIREYRFPRDKVTPLTQAPAIAQLPGADLSDADFAALVEEMSRKDTSLRP